MSPPRSGLSAPRLQHLRRVWAWAQVTRPYWLVSAAILAGAILRFWAIDSGIPYAVGADEPAIMGRAVRMMKTGNFNPQFFDYPSLYLYIQMLTACVTFMAGAMLGHYQSLEQVGPENFYLWGRVVTAVAGIATIAIVYAAGLHWGRGQAAVAAVLMSVFPMHVRESHYALTDVPATFFTALTLLLALRACAAPSVRAFVWAGVAVGLATATKYNAALVMIVPVVAALGSGESAASRRRYLAAAVLSALAAFLICAPYTLLDLPAFLDGFGRLAASYNEPRGEPGWWLYLKHLSLALRESGMLLLGIGLVSATVQAFRRRPATKWWLVTLFPVLYFLFISRQSLVYGRYLLLIVPFIALLMALGVSSVKGWIRHLGAPSYVPPALVAGLLVAVILPPARIAVGFNRMISQPTTHGVAYAWVIENVPAGAHIMTERFEIRLPDGRYRAQGTLRLTDRDYASYRRSGVQYLIASGTVFGPVLATPTIDQHRADAYRKLFENARERFRVTPSPSLPGPEIRIYALDPENK
jgi:4-amino-4-deoxy-L-arabinose transferase-like glycosyltransferase